MKTFSIVGQKHRGFDSHLVGILPGTDVVLVREPDNKFDANAIMVWIDGNHVGYIPSKENTELAKMIDTHGYHWPSPSTTKTDSAYGEMSHQQYAMAVNAKFARSPNTAYPMVQIE